MLKRKWNWTKKFLAIAFSDMNANYDLKVALHFVNNKVN